MDPKKPFCVFCNKRSDDLTLFSENTLARCKAILQINRERNTGSRDVQLPESVNLIERFHLKPCYKRFTALTAASRKILNERIAAEVSAHESNEAPTSTQESREHPETDDTGSTTDVDEGIESVNICLGEDVPEDSTEKANGATEQSTSTSDQSPSDFASALMHYGSFGVATLHEQADEPGERNGNGSSISTLSAIQPSQPNQTSRESLDGEARDDNLPDNSESAQSTSTQGARSTSAVCMFCGYERKRYRNKELFLSFLGTPQAQNSLIADATELNDRALLEKITECLDNNLRMYYHALCRTQYGNPLNRIELQQIGETEWHETRAINSRAFESICNYVEDRVINENQIIFLQTLKDEYVQIIKAEHYNNAKSPTRFSARYLEDKLVKKFGSKIDIALLDNKKVVKPARSVVINPEDMDEFYKRNSRHAVALALRREILSIEKTPLPSDLKVADLIRGECKIPPNLLDFFKVLLHRPTDPEKSPSKTIACESMAYDAIHNVTKGRVKTSKHITLGITMKSLTNSSKVVSILNKEGHIASYTALSELETEATYSSKKRDDVLPDGFVRHPDLNPKVIWDNYERYYDSRGKDTIVKSTVSIAIQIDIRALANSENWQQFFGNISLQELLESVQPPGSTAPSGSTQSYSIDFLQQPGPSHHHTPPSSAESTPVLKRRRTYESMTPDLPDIRKKPRVVQTLLPLDHPYREVNWANVRRANQIDFTLTVSHHCKITNTPMFFGYNSLIHVDTSPKEKVFYMTTMNHSPTDASVVLETMNRSAKAAEECNAPYIQCTYDLGIAKPAFQLQSSEKDSNPKLKKVFYHVGTFHIKLDYQVALGKFVKECGLSTVLIDAELMGTDSANSFVFGKIYSRSKRLHHVSYLALQILHFESFVAENAIDLDGIDELLKDFMKTKRVVPAIEDQRLIQLFDKYDHYKQQTLLGEHGKTAQFYMIYSFMVSNILMLERAIRTSDFDLFMYILPKFTNVFFAFNHQNYARYLTLYHDNLMNVDNSHPGLKDKIRNSLGVKRNDKPFSRQDNDYVLENTINNESANKMTGTRNIMSNLGALQRWADSHTLRTDIIAHTTKKLKIGSGEEVTFELKPSVIKKQTHQLDSLIGAFKQSINPFSSDIDSDKLYNISTGKSVDDKISQSLLEILQTGEALREQFITECSTDPERFERPIKKNKYLTFEDAIPKKANRTLGKVKVLKDQCDVLGRYLAISLKEDLDMEIGMAHPMTKFPACFCHPDGTMTKTDKSALARLILNDAESHAPSSVDYTVIDGYFFLHLLKDVPTKFGSIAQKIMQSSMNFRGNNIILVFDRYFSPSIKDSEHSLRLTERLADRKITGSLQVRAFEWAKELRNVNFKEEIVRFLTREWAKDEYAAILGTRKIFINFENCMEFAVVEGKVQRTIKQNLSCPDHEEADTKLVFHACQAPPSSKVVIRCSDTDVLIILLGNMRHMNEGVEVWLDFGTGNGRRILNATHLRASLGDICDALPGIHAFTGNDYNPCFYGLGKTKAFNIMKDITKHESLYMAAFTALGDDEIPPDLDSTLEDFTCHLYSINNKVLPSLNAVRFAMFQRAYKCERTGEQLLKIKYKFDPARLPPCKAEFTQHFLRSAYICNLWRNAHRAQPTLRAPTDFGWVEEDGKYAFKWFEGDQMPKTVEDVLRKEEEDRNDEGDDVEMISSDEDDDGDLLHDLEYRKARANGEDSETDSDPYDSD